jgi:hypothetical protein
VSPKVINVPVRTPGRHKVMCQACSETAGAKGTADVHVEPRFEMQDAELADANPRSLFRCQHEGVCSGQGVHYRTVYNSFDDFNAREMSLVPRPEFTIDWLPAQCYTTTLKIVLR